MELSMHNASVGYGTFPVLKNISFSLHSGEVICLLGPNGAGKSTIFKTLMGFLRPIDGVVCLNGVDTKKISIKDFAKNVAYVPQTSGVSFPYSVLDIVVMGRTAHLSSFRSPDSKEYHIAENILNFLGISCLSKKLFTQISGGERQLVLIARALAQNPRFLLMDEPTANLDYGNQVLIIQTIKKLKDVGIGILITTHNPDHVFLCGDKVVLLMNNERIIQGVVDDVITEENLSNSYGVAVEIVNSKTKDGKNIRNCIPLLN